MDRIISYSLLIWIGLIGIITFIAYGIDKRRARKKAWRIPEKTLFALNLAGGFIGGWVGMRLFRHKTKHPSFYVVQTLATIIWVGLAVYLIVIL